MEKIRAIIQQLSIMAFLLAGLNACNKEADGIKAVSIEIKGFNVGSAQLEISVDTVVYRNFNVPSNTEVNFSKVFTYPSSTNEVALRIKDINSGKEVYRHQVNLNSSELERFYQFVFIEGQQLAFTPPAADPATNKIGFYIHYPPSNDAIDVFMKNSEGQIAYLAKNVQPSTWVYTDYAGDEGFNNPNTSYNVYFTKAGTTESWAFYDDEYMSRSYSSSMFLPKGATKGRVCSFFVTPGTADLRVVRLFKAPKQ